MSLCSCDVSSLSSGVLSACIYYQPIWGPQITADNRLDEVLALNVFILWEETDYTKLQCDIR